MQSFECVKILTQQFYTRWERNAKKFAYCTTLLFMLSLTAVAISQTSDYSIFDTNHDGGIGHASLSSFFFSELDNSLPVDSEVNVIIDTRTGNTLEQMQIRVAATTITDFVENVFVGFDDGVLPTAAAAESVLNGQTLDLHAGTLSLVFDQTMNVSTVVLSEIEITDQDGNGAVTLGGTELPTDNSTVVVLSLTEAQRQAVTFLQYGTDTTPLKVNISATAIRDHPDGDFFAGDNVDLNVTRVLPTGEPWVSQESGTNIDLRGVHFVNENTGWVVGKGGIMRSTEDGGETWSNVVTLITSTLRDVYFFNSTVGWIAGDTFDINNDGKPLDGIIRYTEDGAESWVISNPRLRNVQIFDIHFINSTHGWAAGQKGVIWNTTDGGTTWNFQLQTGIDADLRGINFVNSTHGWAVGNGGTIIASIKGGTTWSNQTSGVSANLNGVAFVDSNRGWAVGGGGTIIATTNGGTNWSPQTSGVSTILNGIQFVDSNHGWAVGNGGTIIYTSDGGNTWIKQATSVSYALRAIHFTDSGHGWAIGDNGTVLSGFYSDTAPPLLTIAMPNLDVPTRTLSLTFDKTIDVSATNLDGISITGDANSVPVILTGAEVPNTNSNTLVITMTLTQIQSFNDLTFNAASPLRVTVTETAVVDLAGNNFAGITDARLAVTGDNAPPVLTDLTPNLDLVASTLSFEFSEPIDVSEINLDGIIISNATGSDTVELTGARIPNVVSNIVTLGLTEAQVVSLKALMFDDAAPLEIIIPNTAFKDIAGNEFVGIDNAILTVILPAPVLDDQTLNLDLQAGTMSFEFDRTIDVSQIALNGITITDSAGANDISLVGATPPDSDSMNVVLTLTEAQRQAVALLHYGKDTTPLQVDITNSAFKDTEGYNFAGIPNAVLTVTNVLPTGKPWVSQDNNQNIFLRAVDFVNSTHGWTVGYDRVNGDIVRSTIDGGTTWSPVDINTDERLHDVHFIDSNTGWIVGDAGTIRYTNDGAESWSTQEFERKTNIFDIHFINSTHGWAVGFGGTIISTTDSGQTWINRTSGLGSRLHDVHFVDSTYGWVVGDDGKILASTDGGITWNAQTSGVTSVLNGVHFVDSNRGWAVGEFGTIIATIDGGTTWKAQTWNIQTTSTFPHFTTSISQIQAMDG